MCIYTANFLGFGECRAFIDDEAYPYMTPSYLRTVIIAKLGWADWMRLLLSRRLIVSIVTKTDKIILHAKSESKISILPPRIKEHQPAGE